MMTRLLSVLVAIVAAIGLVSPASAQCGSATLPTYWPPYFDPFTYPNHVFIENGLLSGMTMEVDGTSFTSPTMSCDSRHTIFTHICSEDGDPDEVTRRWFWELAENGVGWGARPKYKVNWFETYTGLPCVGIPSSSDFGTTNYFTLGSGDIGPDALMAAASIHTLPISAPPTQRGYSFTLDPEAGWVLEEATMEWSGWLPPATSAYMYYEYELIYRIRAPFTQEVLEEYRREFIYNTITHSVCP